MMDFSNDPHHSRINGSHHCRDLVSHINLQLDFCLTTFFHYYKRYSDGISEMSFHNFLWHKQVQILYLPTSDYSMTEGKLNL